MNGYFYDFILTPVENLVFQHQRSRLLSNVHGKTLEIGAGTGINFTHFPSGIDYIGIELDEGMRSVAEKKRKQYNLQIISGNAEALEFESSYFDTVVATLVFCSIANPNKAIEEVYRVLKPGGTFLLLEHVKKETPLTGTLLDICTPVWKHISGGCHLNRDPSKYLKEVGFKIKSEQTLWRGLGKVWNLQK